jgi:hypothetical protein
MRQTEAFTGDESVATVQHDVAITVARLQSSSGLSHLPITRQRHQVLALYLDDGTALIGIGICCRRSLPLAAYLKTAFLQLGLATGKAYHRRVAKAEPGILKPPCRRRSRIA